MEAKQYLVIQDHTSEYPEPITFEKGAPLTVGERYEGPEGWNGWLFCDTPAQKGGWVPAQIIEIINGNAARAREDYTARELNVQEGDLLLGSRTLNGWVWCKKPPQFGVGLGSTCKPPKSSSVNPSSRYGQVGSLNAAVSSSHPLRRSRTYLQNLEHWGRIIAFKFNKNM